MRFVRPVILAGAVALLAGAAVAAERRSEPVRVMLVAMPDGEIVPVRVANAAPPRVVVVRQEGPFAMLDRVSAMMDARMAAMMRQASMAQPAASAAGAPPAGARYSYTSTTIVDGKTCTTSVESVAGTARAAPTMLRKVSGDGCGTAAKAVPAIATGAASPRPIPAAKPASPTRTVAPDTI